MNIELIVAFVLGMVAAGVIVCIAGLVYIFHEATEISKDHKEQIESFKQAKEYLASINAE